MFRGRAVLHSMIKAPAKLSEPGRPCHVHLGATKAKNSNARRVPAGVGLALNPVLIIRSADRADKRLSRDWSYLIT